MYTDDASDQECEHVDKILEERHNVTKKSVSTVGFRNNYENQNARPLTLRSTQSFSGALEELKLSNNLQRLNLNSENAIPPPKSGCPCGCFLRPHVLIPFRTRERNTLALHIVSPEILHYHGYDFDPSQIAMFWKKDCRKFLWKGNSLPSESTENHHQEYQSQI